jgi:hypothetical protein
MLRKMMFLFSLDLTIKSIFNYAYMKWILNKFWLFLHPTDDIYIYIYILRLLWRLMEFLIINIKNRIESKIRKKKYYFTCKSFKMFCCISCDEEKFGNKHVWINVNLFPFSHLPLLEHYSQTISDYKSKF